MAYFDRLSGILPPHCPKSPPLKNIDKTFDFFFENSSSAILYLQSTFETGDLLRRGFCRKKVAK